MNNTILCLAINTARDIFRQPLFYVITGIGAFFTFSSLFFTLFAFGEEVRLMREMGISTITICCLVLVSLSAANSISKEMESGTIFTLLAKPVSKRSVVLGKFFGIVMVAAAQFLLLGSFLVISLCLKNVFDSHVGFFSSIRVLGGTTFLQLFLSFLQVEIMSAIAIAGSIYLSMAANLSCCVFVYIIGNMLSLVQKLFIANESSFSWFLSFLYVIFPNLEGMGAIGMGNPLGGHSFNSILFMVLYTALYTMLIITVVFEIFEKRECG
ncbi:MAG: ABC transporter permease subunit [Candidatus Kuenenia sp.]|nr:ABC transporter permease subunit [Candidatus Kuenenia hertensis]